MITANITHMFTEQRFMEALFSDMDCKPDWAEFCQYSMDALNCKIRYEDGEEKVTVRLEIEDLVHGYELMMSSGAGHCGEAVTMDFDQWDACCSNLCLQYAIFSEEVYSL